MYTSTTKDLEEALRVWEEVIEYARRGYIKWQDLMGILDEVCEFAQRKLNEKESG